MATRRGQDLAIGEWRGPYRTVWELYGEVPSGYESNKTRALMSVIGRVQVWLAALIWGMHYSLGGCKTRLHNIVDIP